MDLLEVWFSMVILEKPPDNRHTTRQLLLLKILIEATIIYCPWPSFFLFVIISSKDKSHKIEAGHADRVKKLVAVGATRLARWP